MDMGLVRGLITLLTLAAFLGICAWAYRPGNRMRFERDAMLAFDDDEVDEGIVSSGGRGKAREQETRA